MAIETEERRKLIEGYKLHETDSGSPEVQVALLTTEIRALTEHLKRHRKDFTSRRGLLMKVGRRTTLLRYLSRVDHGRYQKLIDRLELRR
jgi:small subunit ribosomal protein S15